MRIIFNVDAISPPLTGIGHYAAQLARGLATHSEIESLRLFSSYRWVDSPEQALAANRGLSRLRERLPFKTLALEAYTQLRAGVFRWRTRRMHDHLFHTPNYVLMPFNGPAVTTVHDLSYLRYPECHPPERIKFMQWHLPETLRRAQAIITDSAFIRDELVTSLAVDRDHVHVVPLGVEPGFSVKTSMEVSGFLNKWNLEYKKYVLVVATQEPRKNLARLAWAYAGLSQALRSRYPLVLVGARGWLGQDLAAALEPLESCGQVRRLGYVAQEELPLIYAGALGFAFPSLYEGFGLPILEAMASGVPVLTSNVASMPEVAGPDSLLVDPNNIDAIRAGLQRMLEDQEWRERAASSGTVRAQAYSWSRCVAGTVDVYRKVLAAY